MAKSKNGGSRAMIRGRIGSDVYSVGKDGKGKKQQVVRSLAVQVSNPRTQSQMFGRMIMSTVMQAVSGLAPIIDHSFDGVAKGQPSISEFIRRNYALVKADAIAHPSSSNDFGLNQYLEKGIKGGRYVLSDGSLILPETASTSNSYGEIDCSMTSLTVGGVKEAMGVSKDGYLTFMWINNDSKAVFVRVQLTTALADDTVVSAENVASLFTLDGNVSATVTLASDSIKITPASLGTANSRGVIGSEKVDGAFIHSACQLTKISSAPYVADVALPTYPVGTEQFLNGGEL